MDKHLEPGMAGDYAEGILDSAARAAADAHLAGCAECRGEVAAAAAYFRDMSALEPIKAPENFLANVRVRLPGESPWRRALSALARPWRVLPLQLALATLIGVTAVSVYVRQGGMEPDTIATSAPVAPQVTSSEPAESPVPASPPAPAVSAPKSLAQEKKEITQATQPASRPVGRLDGAGNQAPPAKTASLPKPRAAKRVAADAASEEAPLLSRRNAPSPASAPRALSDAGYQEDNEALETPAPAPLAAIGRAGESRADAQAPAPRSRPAPAAAAAEPERESAMAEEAQGALGLSERGYGSLAKESGGARAASKSKAEPRAEPEADKRAAPASAPASAPADPVRQAMLTLRLRAIKDTAAILKGLQAMGITVEPAPPRDGLRRRLAAPASMGPDLRAYLSRYGSLSVTPGDRAGAEPARWELILLAP